MGIQKNEEKIFGEDVYPVFLYDSKSSREDIKQFMKKDLEIKKKYLNIKELTEISRLFGDIEILLDMVRTMIMYIISKVMNKGELLTLEDLREIREILQPGYLPLQEKYLEILEQALKVDVERKREVYAKEHGVEWDATLDPQMELKRYSIDLPLIERVKIYLRAEAYAEFSLRKFPLWREFFDEGKISYSEYNERRIKIFQEIFGALSV
jgi:hypothetical protein